MVNRTKRIFLNPSFGKVNFGDLRSINPISSNFGLDRGLPIDRFYIQQFLQTHADVIKGRVLEIGNNYYTYKYGGKEVLQSDVLHVKAGTPQATIIGDLTQADHIPANTFDCIILTQTLQLIYDFDAAIHTLYRILKPGGFVLATIPGISQNGDKEWRNVWCWSFTAHSARKMFESVFELGTTEVKVYGNVLAATAFLQGLAVEELSPEELTYFDPEYEVLIGVKAQKHL